MKYRKKPEEVEAFQYDGSVQWPEWAEIAYKEGIMFFNVYGGLVIDTGKAKIGAYIGDYVVKRKNGEIYPCSKLIFESCYEKVE